MRENGSFSLLRADRCPKGRTDGHFRAVARRTCVGAAALSGLSVWWLVCNPNSMGTREVVLALGIVAAIAISTMLAAFRRRGRFHSTPDNRPVKDCEPVASSDVGDLLRQTLHRDLTLAAEHVHSIRWLLEIARQHQQPIPSAVLTNLDLVSKHLAVLQRRIEAAGDGAASDLPVSALAHHLEIPAPLHPRLPSSGCRVSPSDISTPFG